MSGTNPEFQGQYRARLRHFQESNPDRHGGYLQAGPIAGPKIALVMMVLRVLVFNYPSAIDLGLGALADDHTALQPASGSSSLLPFLVAGFVDYALIIAASSTFSTAMGWILDVVFPDTGLGNLLAVYAQPTCYYIALWYRLRIAGRKPMIRALRTSYRQVLGSVKILLVLLRVWPALAWYIAIDRILGPHARKRMGLLVLQMAITLYTGFWDDSAMQLSKIFEDGGGKPEQSPATNKAMDWGGIITKSLKNTVTYVPIELFVGAIPALLLLAHAGGLPGSVPWLGSLPIVRWAAAVEDGWVRLLNKLPGKHPVDAADVKRLNEFQASQSGQCGETTEAGKHPRFFRLLRVEAGLFEDTIHCSLEWYDLDKAPKYKALSYAWGSSRLSEIIILNGRKQVVTKSAFSALMAVRSEWRSRLFWIDALCIDQTDPVDKAHQIPLMSDIFYKAHKVIVWLGPAGGTDGSVALSAIHKLWTNITLHLEFGGPFETTDIPAPVWRLIRQMLLAPWFQRTWIVQEVVLARGSGSHTVIRYGDGSLDWQTLSWFIRNIRNYPPILNKLLEPDMALDQTTTSSQLTNPSHDPIMATIRNLEAIQDFGTITIRGARGISLAYYMTRMFRTACTFQTKEDKDRVYALLGLPDNRTMSSAVSTVDYEGQTTAELFTKVAIHTLHDERINPPCRIDFLAHAGLSFAPSASSSSPPSTGDIPSWVPNWNITSSGHNLPHPFLGLDGFRELIQGHMDYAFCRSIADMKSFGDINWGIEPYPPFHREYMAVLGNRLIETRKCFYKAGIPASFINKDNAILEMEPKFEVIINGPVGLAPKLKIKGVLAGRVAHVAQTTFPSPGTEKEILYLPKTRTDTGTVSPDGGDSEPGPEMEAEVEMEEHLNPRAFLPPDWRVLALRHGTFTSAPEFLFTFSRTIIGDVSRLEVDLKHAQGVPVRPAPDAMVLTTLAYEKLTRAYFGFSDNLFDLQGLERDLQKTSNEEGQQQQPPKPRPLREVIASQYPHIPAQHPSPPTAPDPDGDDDATPNPRRTQQPGTNQEEDLAWSAFIEILDINKHISSTCGGRTFGVTAGGKLGLFPAGTQVDDIVVVFWGSMVPFVLRRATIPGGGADDHGTSPYYQLVGPCYVHGIMDGEALEGVEVGEGTDYVIV